MGWTACQMPLAELLKSEVAPWKIVKKARGETLCGETSVWLLLEKDGERILAVALTKRNNGWNAVKIITEDMGPSDIDVPDVIWNNLPPCPDSDYARNWRQSVTEYRAKWPMLASEAPVGTVLNLKGDDGIFTVVGQYNGQPVYDSTKYGRCRIKGKMRRARIAVPA